MTDQGNGRKNRGRSFGVRLLTALVYSVVMALGGGWALMVAVGVVRAEWLPGMPTISYPPAVVIVFLLSWVAAAARPSTYIYKLLMGDDV